jgi:predicted ester cyclase
MQFRLGYLVAENDHVVARWSQTGTHTGAFLGIPLTGRQFTTTGIDIHQLSDGRMAEHWHAVDLYGLLQQLGAIPAPDATPA